MAALGKEILSRAEEPFESTISTIYLGGGTPSVLSVPQLTTILELIKRNYRVEPGAEISIEVNPDDMAPAYLKNLREIGFNRISIGIQSFHEEDLQIMRRPHSASQAKRAVLDAAKAGFENITMDLIYGTPGLSNEKWSENLNIAFDLPIQHLSAYHLTFESGTVFDHWRKKGKIVPVSESVSLSQYSALMDMASKHGFTHYEISNLAKGEYYSKHNMIYWNRNNYQGLGPSAHSYNGLERRWNDKNIKKYIKAADTGNPYFDTERLNPSEQYHDYILTSLRTMWGFDIREIEKSFGEKILLHFKNTSEPYIGSGKLLFEDNFIKMTPESWFISDHIMRDLFLPNGQIN